MIENIDFVMRILRVDFFVTFGLYSMIYIVTSIFIKNSIIDTVDKTSNKLIGFIGIVFLLAWISLIVTSFINISGPQRDEVLDRMFGKYWFEYWLQPVLWITMTQLLRFEKIRKLKLLRFFFSLLFIGTIEQYIVLLTSSSRAFCSPWIYHFTAIEIITGISIKLFLFLTVVGIYYMVESKCKLFKFKKVS